MCILEALCPRAHLTHPHLSSALGQPHEGAAGAVLSEELREMGHATWKPEWEAGSQARLGAPLGTLSPALCWAASMTLQSQCPAILDLSQHVGTRKPHEKKLPLPRLGWADLFVCFVCCFLFMLFRIKALGWTFFFSWCSSEKYSLQAKVIGPDFWI